MRRVPTAGVRKVKANETERRCKVKANPTALEDFGAALAAAAYPVALRHGAGDRWLDLELDLWKVLTATVKKWDPESLRTLSEGK